MEIILLKIKGVTETQEYRYGTVKLDYDAPEGTSTIRARKKGDSVKVERTVNQV
jgi:hypothetical protein